MKIYNVYAKNHQNFDIDNSIFLEDKFSWPAFIANFFWFINKKMWFISAIIIAFYCLIIFIDRFTNFNDKYLAAIIIVSPIFFGLFAHQLYARHLIKLGFRKIDIIFSKNLDEAKLKFYKKFLYQVNKNN